MKALKEGSLDPQGCGEASGKAGPQGEKPGRIYRGVTRRAAGRNLTHHRSNIRAWQAEQEGSFCQKGQMDQGLESLLRTGVIFRSHWQPKAGKQDNRTCVWERARQKWS